MGLILLHLIIGECLGRLGVVFAKVPASGKLMEKKSVPLTISCEKTKEKQNYSLKINLKSSPSCLNQNNKKVINTQKS